MVLCTAVLDSLWSMDETRILMGSVELFLDSLCSMEYTMSSVQLFYTHFGFGRYKDTYGLCTAVLDYLWSMEDARIPMDSTAILDSLCSRN